MTAATLIKPAKSPAKAVRKSAVYVPSTDGSNVVARLAALQAAIREADEKLEAAYDRAERGEPYEVLLHHVAHELLIGDALAMLEDSPTQADAAANYEALFKPLAALQGAIGLAQGSGIEGTLKEAFELLDWAQNELDCCAGLPKLLPKGTRAEAAQRETPAPTRKRVDWLEVDIADGDLRSAEILMEMAHMECQWQYSDAEASERAQERIIVMLDAIGNQVAEARERLQAVITEVIGDKS
ncbi:hypothetical protein [Variovorax sp. RA8]|uniref:hypothetical protein n=1 Tax=Variovorax sp. (strain JCM 16519 / RA8) TaxID=662548 RepID=UPI00131735D0|nr:hypothetical protein [Variovorax sp. RA8]VTU34289.1 hypothetical protein RA8CHR_04943 [Variovorax sp. RA8]